MNAWAAAVIIALIIGFVELRKAKLGITQDEHGNETRALPDDSELRREVIELRERVKVLERITTEMNTLEASETRRIAKEIEQLRDN